jgi:hypothetical protein
MARAFSAISKRKFDYPFCHGRRAQALGVCRSYVCLALGLLSFSCGSPPSALDAGPRPGSAPPPAYVIVCVIHGDGGYLYHGPDGRDYQADEEALAGAKRVAERNPQAEVFIFHQKHRRHFLLFFPRHDGEFYYYRNGTLLAQESYWRDKAQSRFDPEVNLYNRFRVEEQAQRTRLFLYFGHEIPEVGGTHYDASYRNRPFTVHDLVDGLRRLTPDSTRFDLVVLSTCFNGTPHTISALSPYARYIIASPGNLHLSYFDLRPFEALDASMRDGDVAGFAENCARQSFDRLTRDIQTEITISVYDIDRTRDFLQSVDPVYDLALASLKEDERASVEHCDCAEDTAYVRPAMSEGIDVFYRPARFGRSTHKQTHSGWECFKRLE